MKKIYFLIIISLICKIAATQDVRTNYFLDQYSHNHIFNPALSPTHGYIYIPVVNLSAKASLGGLSLSKVLFPLNGELVTGLHPQISSDKFLSNLPQNSKIAVEALDRVLSLGFYLRDQFFSFDLSVKTGAYMTIPYDFFNFLKNQTSSRDTRYNFKNLSVGSEAYVEMALGYSRDISESLRVGAKVKVLSGLMNIQAEVMNADLHFSADEWEIKTQAQMRAAGPFLILPIDDNGLLKMDGAGVNDNFPGLGGLGWGGAVDLGAVYAFDESSPLKNLKVSVGLTDLGFIRYKSDNVLQFESAGEVSFKGVNDIKLKDSGIDNVIDDILDELSNMIDFKNVEPSKTSYSLHTKLNVGAEYGFLNNKLSVGLLSATRFGFPATSSELIAFFNCKPTKWFGTSFSTSFAKGLHSLGWALALTPKYGLNLFLGLDYIPFEYTAGDIPIPLRESRFNVSFGLSVPLGGNRHSKYKNLKQEEAPTSEAQEELI
ncbi:hypothetical protein FACS1894201_01670 [Bacteroidia bacterium]|nr:hypothetical protein FACS1894201_01670 [Bacteroidia bacterium]